MLESTRRLGCRLDGRPLGRYNGRSLGQQEADSDEVGVLTTTQGGGETSYVHPRTGSYEPICRFLKAKVTGIPRVKIKTNQGDWIMIVHVPYVDVLNALGDDGWELVAISGQREYVLKRPQPE